MFKRRDETEAFINHLEGFVRAGLAYSKDQCSENAAILNKKRDAFEEFLNDICGLTQPEVEPDEYKCPDCLSPMKMRTNRQNGNKFYGCIKYPDCRGTRDENGLSRAEREEKKYKQESTQQDGYSFNKKRDVLNEGRT
jgi:hypothetical protein